MNEASEDPFQPQKQAAISWMGRTNCITMCRQNIASFKGWKGAQLIAVPSGD
jgi:hypothetical protein